MQLLIDLYPDAVRSEYNTGRLPIHLARNNVLSRDIVQFLLDSYNGDENNHKSSSVTDNMTRNPLMYAAIGMDGVSLPVSAMHMQLLIDEYPESIEIADNIFGMLPLHWLCAPHHE